MKGLSPPPVLGALLVGVLAWLFLGDDPPAVDHGGDAGDPGTAAFHARLQATALPDAPSDGGGGAFEGRRALEDRRNRSTPPDPAPPRVTVRGRCVDDRHATPLAGVAVDLAVVPRRFGRRVEGETPVSRAPRVYCDAHGRFEVALEVPTQHQVRIRTSIQGRANMQGYPRPGTGNTVDTGDIPIPLGARLSAAVVDRRGQRQPDVLLRLRHVAEGQEGQDTIRPVPWLEARSDASGRIQTEIALAAGRWTLAAGEGFRLIEPPAGLVVPAGVSSLEAWIVVERRDPHARITGTCRDERGRPLRRVIIHAEAAGRSLGHGVTNADGRFQIERTGSNVPVQLVVPHAAGFESLTTRETWAWGSTDVTLSLAPATDLKVTVCAEDDGSPIEDFGMAWCLRDPRGSWHPCRRHRPARHARGAVLLRAVPAGRVRVVVLPHGRAFAPNDPVEFTKPPGPAELRIAVPRRHALPVLVVDAARRPVENTRLQLVRSLDGRPVPLQPDCIDHGRLAQAGTQDSRVLLLDSAETDAQGRATLRWHLHDRALAIRALGPGHVPMALTPVFLRPDPRLVKIVVARGATLRGRVTPLDVLSSLTRPPGKWRTWTGQPDIELSYRGTPRSGRPPDITAPIDKDGEFLLQGLAQGTWDVTLRIRRLGGRHGGIQRQEYPSITLRPGEQRHLALDIRNLGRWREY